MSILDLLSQSQSGKEVTANRLFEASLPAMLFARREAQSSGLNHCYYGGLLAVDGLITTIANNASALVLSASATNYIEASRSGVVTKNTTAFTPGAIPLYIAITNATTVTALTDQRAWVQPSHITPRARIERGTGNLAESDRAMHVASQIDGVVETLREWADSKPDRRIDAIRSRSIEVMARFVAASAQALRS